MGTSAPAVPERVCLKLAVQLGNRMNLYMILGVPESANAETIKKAYRKLVKECHPDTHPGDRKAEERFKQVSEAYAVLSDEEKRRKYDRERAAGAGRQNRSAAEPKKATPKNGTKKNPIDTSDLFERYMGFR